MMKVPRRGGRVEVLVVWLARVCLGVVSGKPAFECQLCFITSHSYKRIVSTLLLRKKLAEQELKKRNVFVMYYTEVRKHDCKVNHHQFNGQNKGI